MANVFVSIGNSSFIQNESIIIKSVKDFDAIYFTVLQSHGDIVARDLIYWLFHDRCVMCRHDASQVNEIIPRARDKNAIKNWRNRVPLCHDCHDSYHHAGVSDEAREYMTNERKKFLIQVGKEEYV